MRFFRTVPKAHTASSIERTGFSGDQAVGAWLDPPPPQSSAEENEGEDTYFYFPSELSWPVNGGNLTFTLLFLTLHVSLTLLYHFRCVYCIAKRELAN